MASPLFWFLIAWFSGRMLLVSVGIWDLPFYPGGQLAFDDLAVYEGWLASLSEGVTPQDEMWQYPPLAGVFFLVGTIGSQPVVALLIAILLVDLTLALVLFGYAPRAGWFWIVAGLAVGPILVSRFDVVPTLFAVLAVVAASRPVRVGLWAALGASVKVWPVLMLFIVPRRQAIRAGSAFVIVSAVIVMFTTIVFSGTPGFLSGQGSRGLQVESVAALPFLLARAAGADVSLTYRYGAIEVDSTGAGVASTIAVAAALILFGWLAVVWWRGSLEKRLAPDVALTAVLFSVVTSRVFSPQFSIWLLGIGALCWALSHSLLHRSVGLVLGASLIAQVLYPWGYGALLAGEWWAVVAQTLRIGMVLAATVLAARAVLLPGRSRTRILSEESAVV